MTGQSYPTIEELAMRILGLADALIFDLEMDKPVTRDLDELEAKVIELRELIEQRHLNG